MGAWGHGTWVHTAGIRLNQGNNRVLVRTAENSWAYRRLFMARAEHTKSRWRFSEIATSMKFESRYFSPNRLSQGFTALISDPLIKKQSKAFFCKVKAHTEFVEWKTLLVESLMKS
jgi:hypothetical protein